MAFSQKPYSLAGALLHWAEETPDTAFILSAGGNFSFAETQTVAASLVGFLRGNKVPAKARICLLLPRAPELILSFMAANMAGCLPAPVNYLETLENIKKIILALEPAVIIVDETVISKEVRKFIQGCKALVISTSSPAATGAFLDWDQCVSRLPLAEIRSAYSPDDSAYLNFTSGSTGSPKGALCTQANLYWNTRSVVEAFQLTAKDVHLCMFASFAHPHELFCRALYTGGSVALLTAISPKAIIRTINAHRVSCMMGLAVMYKMMAEHCAGTALPSLRIAESGGMFTSPELHKNFLAAFQVPILSVWGSTETTGVALVNVLEDRRTDGSMGRVSPHYQVRLVDEDGGEVQTGEIGEMLFSGPAVVAGYHHDVPFPELDGCFRSGDLARRDKDGFYHFVERKSGMIKVAGLKVYPLQVEQVLLRHPDIEEVAVIGMKEKRRGCVPLAFVVAKKGVRIDQAALILFCKNRLAPYMVPKQFRQLDSLPKIGSGKINKKALPPSVT